MQITPEQQRQIVREKNLTKAGIALEVLEIEGVVERTRAAVEAMREAGRDDEQIYDVMFDDNFQDRFLFGRNLSNSEIDEQTSTLTEMGIE